MLTLPRVLARQFRAVLRRSLLHPASRDAPFVRIHAGPDGLTLAALRHDGALLYQQPGPVPDDVLVFSSRYLADLEGGKGSVRLEAVSFGKSRACWDDGGVPRCLDLDTVVSEGLPELPALPQRLTEVGPAFLTALAEAARTAAKDSSRFALAHIQLRGQRGQVVATDGRQLLVQGGFDLPWNGDVLIPALSVFGCRELQAETSVSVGCTATHVAVRAGPWTLVLASDATARFPDVDAVIPQQDGKTTRLWLAEDDARFLLHALPKLPDQKDDLAPVTLDLGDEVVVRARAEGTTQISELVLTGSRREGPAVRTAVNRRYLLRLVQLGFRMVQVTGPSRPLLCQDDGRVYVFMPLDADAVVPPGGDVSCVRSASVTAADQPAPVPVSIEPARMSGPDPNRRCVAMLRPEERSAGPQGNGPQANGHADSNAGLDELIQEAEALRAFLLEVCGRLTHLSAGLKRHRKRGRAVEAALAALSLKLPALP